MAQRASDPHDSADGPAAMIDWDFALATAERLMRPSPEVDRHEARQIVADLRRYAATAEGHVRGYTGLETASATAPIVVVDRPGWVKANIDGMRLVIDPLVSKLRKSHNPPSGVAAAIGSRVTGLEAGGLFAYLSNKVLGQFDPFYAGPGQQPGSLALLAEQPTAGRLLLVAPNIVHVERELDVVPADFRLWVCLHEETHRVQFTAVPWLRSHLLSEMTLLLDKTDLDPNHLAEMARQGIERFSKMLRGDTDVSLLDLLQTPEQRAVLQRLTALMSLLEGHADVVMDGVGPEVIPTVEAIRTKFSRRRAGGGPLDQLIRKLLGYDAKLRQYKEGAVFVRGVLDKVGMSGFNAVWAEPANLPTRDEILNPAGWVTRVHG